MSKLTYFKKIQYAFLSVLILGILATSGVYMQAQKFEAEQERAEAIIETTEQEKPEVLCENISMQITAQPKYIGKFKVTAYCPCSKCCGRWAKNRPIDENGKEIVYTSIGEVVEQGVTVSVDPNVIPIGTKLLINGKEYIAQDTGSKVKGNIIDIFFNNHKDAAQFGCKQLDVYIIEEVAR